MAAEHPRRVLLTADTVGGVWTYAVELCAALAARGVRVALATMGRTLSAAQRAQIAAVPAVTLHESAYRLEWMNEPWDDVARAGAWLLRLERELRPDLVHLNQFAFGALPFAAPTLVVAHSCVCSWWRAVHGEIAPTQWNRYRQAVAKGLASATLVGAPTRAMLRTLAENYGFEREGVVLPNGRSADRYTPAAEARVVFAAGRLWDAAKNLAALDAIAPALPWPVHVAGSNAHPDGGACGTRNVVAVGELEPDALAQHLARAAIFAHPAFYEPFGLSVLEAALSGCALVLGDIPSLREVWGDAALYVPPGDHAALRDALLRLIEDESLRRTVGGAARRRASMYSPHRMANACLAAYSRVLGSRRTAGAGQEPPRIAEKSACAS
jgi:glycosyltransferase involved in cell wall biosynthesis